MEKLSFFSPFVATAALGLSRENGQKGTLEAMDDLTFGRGNPGDFRLVKFATKSKRLEIFELCHDRGE